MKEQPSGIPQIRTNNALQLVDPREIAKRQDEIRGIIAQRAYELFESRGRTPGNELEDWCLAEAELLQPLKLDLTESNDAFTVRTPLPGFQAYQLMVAVEPRRLTIAGNRGPSTEAKLGEKGRAAEARHVLHVLDLSTDIDPSRVTAALRGDILELTLSKTRPGQMARTATQVG